MFENIKKQIQSKPKSLAALLGALYTLGFAPFSLWVLGGACLGGLFYLFMKASSKKEAFKIGLIFGFVHFVTSLHWLVGSFYVTLGSLPFAILVGGLCVMLLSLYLAFYTAMVGRQLRLVADDCSGFAPFVFATFWLISEFIRSILTPTFAWNLAGYQWAFSDNFLQIASFGGIYLLSFVLLLAASSLFYGRKWRIFSVVLLVFCYGYGYQRLLFNPVEDVTTPAADKLHIRLVSGNVDQMEKWKPLKRKAFIDRYITQSNDGETVPDVVIWPETAVTAMLNQQEKLRTYLSRYVLAPTLVVGAPYINTKGQFYNSLYALQKGEEVYRYDKRHLVPFGEYFPLREYFPALFELFLQGQGEYTPGAPSQKTFSVRGVSFSPLICGEVVLPNSKGLVSEDSPYVLNITNDAWFEGTIGPYQHFAFSKVRAISLGKSFIRVGNFGVNAFIDRFGRTVTSLDVLDDKPLNIYIKL